MPFQQGQSGNPTGRPKGVRDRRAILRDRLASHLPAILKTLVKAAKRGDLQAAKLILERTLPVLKSAAEPLTLPAAVTAVAAQARVVEAEELAQRVQALEQALSGQR